jgi:hypothetical protein
MYFACVGAFVKAMVQNLGQCGARLATTERIAKTARWKRLHSFAAKNVTNFPSGTNFTIAMLVAGQNVMVARTLQSAPCPHVQGATFFLVSSVQ